MKRIKRTSILFVVSTALLIAVVLLVVNYARSADTVILPPTELKISSTVDGNSISWKETDYATSYRVYRRGIGGTWEQIAVVPSSKQTYLDLDSPKSICQYAVKAFHKSFFSVNALSEMSDPVSVGPADFTLDVPVVKAVRTQSGIRITWTSVDYATSYRLYRRPVGGDWSLIQAFGASQFTYEGEYEGDDVEYAVRSCSTLTGETKLSAYSPAVRPQE